MELFNRCYTFLFNFKPIRWFKYRFLGEYSFQNEIQIKQNTTYRLLLKYNIPHIAIHPRVIDNKFIEYLLVFEEYSKSLESFLRFLSQEQMFSFSLELVHYFANETQKKHIELLSDSNQFQQWANMVNPLDIDNKVHHILQQTMQSFSQEQYQVINHLLSLAIVLSEILRFDYESLISFLKKDYTTRLKSYPEFQKQLVLLFSILEQTDLESNYYQLIHIYSISKHEDCIEKEDFNCFIKKLQDFSSIYPKKMIISYLSAQNPLIFQFNYMKKITIDNFWTVFTEKLQKNIKFWNQKIFLKIEASILENIIGHSNIKKFQKELLSLQTYWNQKNYKMIKIFCLNRWLYKDIQSTSLYLMINKLKNSIVSDHAFKNLDQSENLDLYYHFIFHQLSQMNGEFSTETQQSLQKGIEKISMFFYEHIQNITAFLQEIKWNHELTAEDIQTKKTILTKTSYYLSYIEGNILKSI